MTHYNIWARTAQKTPFFCCREIVALEICLFAEPLLLMDVVYLLIRLSLPSKCSICHNNMTQDFMLLTCSNVVYLFFFNFAGTRIYWI
jgi:hypothetical protein